MSVKVMMLLCVLLAGVSADVYLHGCVRGSNNRNCETTDRRSNANRLFDSQNNNKGGYACPRAFPYADGTSGKTLVVDSYGEIIDQQSTAGYTDTPTFYVYAGSKLALEWTNQHGGGDNPNMFSDFVLQYMTNDPTTGNKYLRDGTPVQDRDDGGNTNDEATTTITHATILDGRYGYHEPYSFFDTCLNTTRNKGLYVADQNLQGDSAKYTRQNPNGAIFGFECAEERDYYPYWRPSPWHDIAIITKDVDRCQTMLAPLSQNVVSKFQCVLPNASPTNRNYIAQPDCVNHGGTWTETKPWNTVKDCGFNGNHVACDAQPECVKAPYSRDNHLGNQVGSDGIDVDTIDDSTVRTANYVWNVPEFIEETKIVFRIRYNVSTYDFDMQTTDSRFNDRVIIVDRSNSEVKSYVNLGLAPSDAANPDVYSLGLATNSNQYFRTFEDRTYVFIVKPLPSDKKNCRGKVVNLNLRGKRGNIVQTYPAVEYDFCPQKLQVTEGDCLHIQWTGSDYNPNRNPNDAEGGPSNPVNTGGSGADRTNFVQMAQRGVNVPLNVDQLKVNNTCFFRTSSGDCDFTTHRKFAFLDQNMNTCKSITELTTLGLGGRENRERDVRNCGKLSAAPTPYFDGGVIRVARKGTYHFMSTRNNNFSNRSQKMTIVVLPGNNSSSGELSGGQKAGVAIGVLAAVGILGAVAYKSPLGARLKQSMKGSSKPTLPSARPKRAPVAVPTV